MRRLLVISALLVPMVAHAAWKGDVADDVAHVRVVATGHVDGARLELTNQPCMNGSFIDGEFMAYSHGNLLAYYVSDARGPIDQGCWTIKNNTVLLANPDPNRRAIRIAPGSLKGE